MPVTIPVTLPVDRTNDPTLALPPPSTIRWSADEANAIIHAIKDRTTYRGTWSIVTQYYKNDFVLWNDTLYSAVNDSVGSSPPSAAWEAIVSNASLGPVLSNGAGPSGSVNINNLTIPLDFKGISAADPQSGNNFGRVSLPFIILPDDPGLLRPGIGVYQAYPTAPYRARVQLFGNGGLSTVDHAELSVISGEQNSEISFDRLGPSGSYTLLNIQTQGGFAAAGEKQVWFTRSGVESFIKILMPIDVRMPTTDPERIRFGRDYGSDIGSDTVAEFNAITTDWASAPSAASAGGRVRFGISQSPDVDTADNTTFGTIVWGLDTYTNPTTYDPFLEINAASNTIKLGYTGVIIDSPASDLLTLKANSVSKVIFTNTGRLDLVGPASGSNAITIPSGARLHFNGGVADLNYLHFSGGNITAAGSFGVASTLYASNGVYTSQSATWQLTNYNAGPLKIGATSADGGTAVCVVLDNTVALANTAAKIVSIRNGGVEKAYVNIDGAYIVSGAASNADAIVVPSGARITFDGPGGSRYLTWNGSTIGSSANFSVGVGNISAGQIYPASTSLLQMYGRVVDGSSAIGVKIGNVNSLANATAKILSLYSDQGTTERAYFDSVGGFTVLGTAATGNAITIPTNTRIKMGGASDYFYSNGAGIYFASPTYTTGIGRNGAANLSIFGLPADSSTAVAISLQAYQPLVTAGAKIVSFQNSVTSNGAYVEFGFVDKDGGYYGVAPAATAGITLQNSPNIGLRARYWNGSASTNYDATIQHIMTATTPISKLSFQFAGVEKAYLDKNGALTLSSAFTGTSADVALIKSSSTFLQVQGGVADGGTAIAVKFGNATGLANATAKIAAFYSDNFVTEKASIDAAGKFTSAQTTGNVAIQLTQGAQIHLGGTQPLYADATWSMRTPGSIRVDGTMQAAQVNGSAFSNTNAGSSVGMYFVPAYTASSTSVAHLFSNVLGASLPMGSKLVSVQNFGTERLYIDSHGVIGADRGVTIRSDAPAAGFVVTNNLLYSEQFQQAAVWVPASVGAIVPVVTSNAAASPNAAVSAEGVVYPAVNAGQTSALGQTISLPGSTRYCYSVWLRAQTGTATTYIYVASAGSIVASQVCNLTTDWQRYYVVFSTTAATNYVVNIGCDTVSTGTTMTAQAATSLYAWGAQLDQGASNALTTGPQQYVLSTTAAASSTLSAGLVIDTAQQFASASTSRLFSVRNGGVELFSFSTDGSSSFANTISALTRVIVGTTGIQAAVGTYLALQGRMTDTSAAYGTKMGAITPLTQNGAKIVGFFSDGFASEKAYIDIAGTFSGYSVLVSNGLVQSSTAIALSHIGAIADGAAAIANKIGNANALANAGAKIVSFYSDNIISEQAFVGVTGKGYFKGGVAGANNALTYSTNIAVDANTGLTQVITVTNNTGFTIANPTNGLTGQYMTIRVRNTSGGAMGTITWDTQYKLATWTNPANGFSRAIVFNYDGTNWVEVHRTTADIPN